VRSCDRGSAPAQQQERSSAFPIGQPMPLGSDEFGLSCALTTPFRADGRCDLDLFVDHARSRLSAGCSSITVFGTTGEGASLDAGTREAILRAIRAGGIDFRLSDVLSRPLTFRVPRILLANLPLSFFQHPPMSVTIRVIR
jgi:hypothetical protein